MEELVLQLLRPSVDVPRTIKHIVLRSEMRDVEKPGYAVELLNIARKHNLI